MERCLCFDISNTSYDRASSSISGNSLCFVYFCIPLKDWKDWEQNDHKIRCVIFKSEWKMPKSLNYPQINDAFSLTHKLCYMPATKYQIEDNNTIKNSRRRNAVQIIFLFTLTMNDYFWPVHSKWFINCVSPSDIFTCVKLKTEPLYP